MAAGFDAWALLSSLGPKAYEWGQQLVKQRGQKALQDSRNQLATEVSAQIVRMILSGKSMADADLLNLVAEFNALLDKGAKLPRDLETTVLAMVQRAAVATYAGSGATWERWPTHDSGHRVLRYDGPQHRITAKKSPAPPRKLAAKKARSGSSTRTPARKMTSAAAPAKKQAPAKKAAAGKNTASRKR